MRRTALFLTAAALVVSAAHLSAQAPNFAGTWTPIVDPNAPAMGGRGGGGAGPMTISQDSKTLTITRSMGGNDVKQVYNLDGTDSHNAQMGRNGGAATDVVSHAKWDGSKLVVTTTTDMGNGPTTTTTAYSLDASGNLAVASTRPGRGGGDPTTTTRSYKKS